MKENGHAIVPSASLLPDNDSTTLFTGSADAADGAVPAWPEASARHASRTRRNASARRTWTRSATNRHTTFRNDFGNWSLGDYFKEPRSR